MIDLIEAGLIPPDFEDTYGDFLLMKAMSTQDEKLIERILDIGVDPDHSNRFGQTALMHACRVGYEKSVRALLWDSAEVQNARFKKLQCYPLRKNRFGKTAVDYAIQSKHFHLADLCIKAMEGFRVEASGKELEM